MTMKAFLIDPSVQTITEVEYSGDYKQIYDLIDCHTFDVVYIDESHCIYVDDEGLMKPNLFFWLEGLTPTPLAGKALVLGTDDEGESIAPTIELPDPHWMTPFPGGFLTTAGKHIPFGRFE